MLFLLSAKKMQQIKIFSLTLQKKRTTIQLSTRKVEQNMQQGENYAKQSTYPTSQETVKGV